MLMIQINIWFGVDVLLSDKLIIITDIIWSLVLKSKWFHKLNSIL